jgi:signal transduction histidine kinase
VDRESLVSRWRRGLVLGRRTWILTAPIHLIAFLVLYVATDRLVETQVIATATESTREWLKQASGELYFVGRAHSGREGEAHMFEPLLEAHRDINFRLFLPGGRTLGPEQPPSRREHTEMVGFLGSGAEQQIWFREEAKAQEMRAFLRLVTNHDCTPCHAPGATIAVASMAYDLAPLLGPVKKQTRLNLALLVVVWAGILALTTVLVQRTVRRSAARLEAELEAVGAGPGDSNRKPTMSLMLDPVSAQLHESLRRFLQRQREERADVVSRLAHTDQLASLGRLAAGLAHEIKNPLAGIQGALEIIRQDDPDGSNTPLYDEMLAELERVDGTLHSLLTSARPSLPRLIKTDLRELLQEVYRLLEPSLRRKGVRLKTEIAPGRLEAEIDAGKIRQVLVNLVQNAAEAMDGAGGTVTLRTGALPEGEGVIVTVEDNGPGIPQEHQAKILDPFYTTKFSGTGLGLAIAQTLVEQHGGSLQFDSEPGIGTTFYVLLPKTEASEPAAGDDTAGKSEVIEDR